jgi:hypothetical protein
VRLVSVINAVSSVTKVEEHLAVCTRVYLCRENIMIIASHIQMLSFDLCSREWTSDLSLFRPTSHALTAELRMSQIRPFKH